MRSTLQTTTLILLALFLSGAVGQELIASRDKYCKDVTFDRFALSASDLKGYRDHTYTDFYGKYDRLFEFIDNPNSNNFLKLFRWQFGLYLTLVLLILISLLFFIIYCCVRIRCRPGCHWPCFWLFVFFFLCFLGLYIAILVFIGISQNHAGPAYCAIHSLPATLVYGNPGATHNQEFIGYAPMSYLLGNYTAELGNLRNVNAQANAIGAANLQGQATTAAQANVNFWRALQSQRITGVDKQVIPDLVIRSPYSGFMTVESDFDRLTDLARDLHISASETLFPVNPDFVTQSSDALNGMNAQLKASLADYENISNEFTRRAMKIQSYAIGGFWTFFAIGIAILVLCIAIIIIFVCLRRDRCVGCWRFMKFLLIFLAILALVYGICVLILMAGVAGGSSFCTFVAELNQGGWTAANTFEHYFSNGTNGINQTSTSQLVKGCFFKNSTGSIPNLFNATTYVQNQYERLINIIQGHSAYNNYVRHYNLADGSTPGITNLTYWTNALRAGDLYDNTRIYDSNRRLNDLVSCDGKQYGWTKNTCDNYLWASCGAFPTGFQSPTCSSNAAFVNSAYSGLSGYLASEILFLNNLDGSLPALTARYNALKSAIYGQRANIEAIQAQVPNTLKTISAYNNTLREIINCNNIQVELIQFERYVCFPFVKPLYVLLVLATISTLFLFFALWALWAAIASRYQETTVVVTETTVDRRGATMVAKDEFLAVSEQELVPKY